MSSTTYRLDPTHMGLRIALLGVFFISLVIGVFLAVILVVNVAHMPNPLNVVAIPVVAACVALGSGWGAEKILTRTWPSGKTLHVSGQGVTLNKREGRPTTIAWDQRVNVMTWHFRIRKGRPWVPKGWYCVACQLKQDDVTVVPYTFVRPGVAEAWPEWIAFPELLPRKAEGKSKKEHPLSDIGAQAPLRYAEQDRWHFGVEMTPADFVQLLADVKQHVPDWQASS